MQLTSFVGRTAELGALTEALLAGRLVSVVGPGGCGKTRLAAEVARQQRDRWPDGVCWVDLATTGDPAVVPELVAAATGVLLTADLDGIPALARQLDDRRMLVCLDNCEHVLGVVAEVVVELVRSCPGVTVLATSREPLGVAGETVWRVPSLTGDDAIALFAERAGPVGTEDAGRAAVHTACIRLDGIPLAIELAAAWSGTLSAAEILQGLDDRFSLLVRGPRGVAARHQTLAASMAWSHDLLAESDRVLFRRLAVFHGGFTLQAARGVCATDPLDGTAVLAGLRRLVDKSLLVADTRGAVSRYRMLETIHQYAAARLEFSGETAATSDRHLDTYLTYTDEATPLLARDKDAWRAVVDAELENLRAAVEWGLSADDPARGRRLTAALPWLWHLGGRGHEGIALLRRAIDQGAGERTELQARLLNGLALVADTARPDGDGLEYDAAQSALEIATEVGDASSACLARLLSAVGSFFGDFDAAWSLAETAQLQARQAGEEFVVDGATALMGIICHLRDDHDAATRLLREAVDGLARRGDRGVASTALGFLASSLLYTGDLTGAREYALDGVRMARPLSDYHRIGSASGVLATVELAADRRDAAQAALDPVIRLVEGVDPTPFVPGLTRAMGLLRLRSGDPIGAINWFAREANWVGPVVDAPLPPQTLTGLAAALHAAGADADAAAVCDRALAVAQQIGMPRVVAEALEQSALLADPIRADTLHHEALALRADHGLWLSCIDSLEALAVLAAGAESFAESARLLAACDRARERQGCPRPVRELLSDRLRKELGDDAYAAARAEGDALELAAAVDYARRSRGRRGRPSSGWGSLTPTERSVVGLAAEGLNNPEIGSRLFMSRSTVKTHLSHVYAKLGVTNRTELATVAAANRAND
jgi:predicted ATPase/DNA-binding CsgD family transcriptional regulator